MFDLTRMDWISVQATAALITGVVSIITATITAVMTSRAAIGRGKIDRELAHLKGRFDEDLAKLKSRLDNKVIYVAEDVANALMRDPEWRLRSWDVIKAHLGGFSDDELRKILVRAGAIRFETQSGTEVWGLLERCRDLLGATRVPLELEDRAGPEGGVVIHPYPPRTPF